MKFMHWATRIQGFPEICPQDSLQLQERTQRVVPEKLLKHEEWSPLQPSFDQLQPELFCSMGLYVELECPTEPLEILRPSGSVENEQRFLQCDWPASSRATLPDPEWGDIT